MVRERRLLIEGQLQLDLELAAAQRVEVQHELDLGVDT
jgi:hypothetical protein